MSTLRLLVLSALVLLSNAIAHEAPGSCIADYGSSSGRFEPCGSVSVEWIEGLAKNCTAGDLAGAYATLLEYCEDARREHADGNSDGDPEDYNVRIIMRRPSGRNAQKPMAQTSPEDSTVEPREWQSSSSSSKHSSWAWKRCSTDGHSLTTIFAERSVHFALSGLLLTTLMSFLFL